MARRKNSNDTVVTVGEVSGVTEVINNETANADVTSSESSAPATEEKTEAALEMENILEKITSLVSKYNESSMFREFETMKELEGQIADKVKKYNELAWSQCVEELRGTEDPMKEAAIRQKFDTIKVTDEKQEEGGSVRVIKSAKKYIDILGLHSKITGGIGYDKRWNLMLEKLNMLITCRQAILLGIDPTTVNKSYAMRESAKKMDMFLMGVNKYDKNNGDEYLKKDLQTLVNAMLGEGYELTDVQVNYFLSVYAKKGTKSALSVVCSNHKYMRQHMLDICHSVITGEAPTLDYKKEKDN